MDEYFVALVQWKEVHETADGIPFYNAVMRLCRDENTGKAINNSSQYKLSSIWIVGYNTRNLQLKWYFTIHIS